MKKIILLSLFSLSFLMAKSQCSSIYGLILQGNTSSLATVDRFKGGYSVVDSLPSIETLVFGTPAIQPDSNRYIVLGMDSSNTQRVYSINFFTGKIVYQPVCDSSLSDFHYDVKRKKLFALKEMVSFPLYQWSLVTVNPVNGSVTVLDSITGMRDVIGETSTIGMDSSRYYVMGLDTSYTQWLYALDENTGKIKYKKLAPDVYECQYDTVSKMIYCVNDTGSYPTYKFFFNSLNPTTGVVTVIDSIPYMQDLLGGSSAFAQDSLNYFVANAGLSFYSIHAHTGNTLRYPAIGNVRSYSGTQYYPCNANYCNNTYSQPICIATLDTATNKYKIIWGRNNSPPAGGYGHYNIYKDTGLGYALIHSQPLDSLSEYTDPSSNPLLGSATYKISTVDSCGESALSALHTTVFLTTTASLNAYHLNWTAYVGFTPTQYRIFRGPSLNKLKQIDSVAHNVLKYTDTLPPLGSYYAIEAVSPNGVCIPTTHRPNSRLSATLSGSFSNGFNTATLGISNINTSVSKLNIYPNPSNGLITLNYSLNGGGHVRTTIVNELGQIVYDNTAQKSGGNITEQLNLGSLASGIYSLRLQTDNSIMVRKLVLMGSR